MPRIFPQTEDKTIDSIDWSEVEKRYAKIVNEDNSVKNQLLDAISKFAQEDNQDVTTAGAEHLKEYQFTKKTDEDKSSKDSKDDDDDDDTEKESAMLKEGKPSKEANSRIRKIHIAHPAQISHEALEAAREAGDTDLVNVILSAREERRIRLASNILDKLDNQDINQKIAKRHTNRMKIVAKAASVKQDTPDNTKVTVSNKSGFKTVKAMNSVEKEAFLQNAIANGFPKEYVVAMIGDNKSSELSEAEKEIRSVMSSELPINVKKAALKGLVKVAVLDSAQIERQKRYWKVELGYGDAEWIDDLFTPKYNKLSAGDSNDNDGDTGE